MARQVRIQFEGAVYHVMARGDRRESIIGGDKDRRMFIETVSEACEKTGWLVDVWVSDEQRSLTGYFLLPFKLELKLFGKTVQ
jgi:REP element-mobilizing transposase RayT